MAYGFIYCLGNEYMPETYKIGMTERSPTQRSIELSNATGVPVPFDLLCYGEVEDPMQVEREIHEYFQDWRVNLSREFFRCPYNKIREIFSEYSLSMAETYDGERIREFYERYEQFLNASDDRDKAYKLKELAICSGLYFEKNESGIYVNGNFTPFNSGVRSLIELMIPLLMKHLENKSFSKAKINNQVVVNINEAK